MVFYSMFQFNHKTYSHKKSFFFHEASYHFVLTTKTNHFTKYFIFHQSSQWLILMKCGYIPHVFLLNMLVLSIMYISEILFLPRTQGVGHYAVIKYVIFEMKYTTKPSLSHGYFCGFRYYNRWSVSITKQIHGIPKALEENGHRKNFTMIFRVVLSHDFQPHHRCPTGLFFLPFSSLFMPVIKKQQKYSWVSAGFTVIFHLKMLQGPFASYFQNSGKTSKPNFSGTVRS